MVYLSLWPLSHEIWPFPSNMATPLIRLNFFEPLVTIFTGVHCTRNSSTVELRLSGARLSGLFDYPDLFPWSRFFHKILMLIRCDIEKLNWLKAQLPFQTSVWNSDLIGFALKKHEWQEMDNYLMHSAAFWGNAILDSALVM